MAITLDISSRRISRFKTFDKMKFLIVSLAIVAVVVAQQPHQQPLAILRQAQDISPEGSYSFGYETENGISASEQGSPQPVGPKGEHAVVAQGQYQYTAPDGTPIAVSYSADETGFHPQGAHLPVAPPVPELIQRAVDYVLAHPQPEHLKHQ
ncbi:endocuticle structural glycoprotein SgAbd-8-like [Cataglyphis hispanica]|uniref:endocuticle structural glycoprotein SgAbd-8-like n=1 Tax=Cataglyphis hispanica TaxID=1086592 RepID=UPI0021801C5C|nr:endocuticle structural glycoprotein SgAbd-8-like [Cataglyphis hispanica]